MASPPVALPAVRGAPKIAVGRQQTFIAMEQNRKSFCDHSANSGYVRIEVVREINLGDQLDGSCFKQLGGILVKVTDKPEYAPALGKPLPKHGEL